VASLRQHIAIGQAVPRLGLDVLLHTHPLAAVLFCPVPTVIVLLDVYPILFPRDFPRGTALYYKTVVALAGRRASAVIAISEATRRDARDRLGIPESRIRVVPLAAPPGCRPLRGAPELSLVLGRLGVPRRYVLYHGNKRPHKNLSGLVRAYRRLLERGADPPPLVVTGAENPAERDQDFRPLRVEIARAGLEGHVHFTGWVAEQDVPYLLSGAELLVMPSLYEGFGLPALEAMACGTAVVASRAGAIPEVVGDAALLVDPTDTEGLAAAMDRVLTDGSLREELAARGMARAAQFSWSETAKGTLAVLEAAREAGRYEGLRA
jgi:alpha-1,3-rhamnosyl/mannosyltransferase